MASYVTQARHREDSRLGRMAKALDHLTSIMTADLIVDFGVFLTGMTLIFLELGLVPHRPLAKDHAPEPVVIVRTVRADTSEPGATSGH